MALTRMAGDVALLQQMVVFFREDAPEYLARLKTAVAAGDAPGVQHAAHSLRGMLAMFTAEAAMQVASQLEQTGRAGDLACAPAQTIELENEVFRMLTTLTAEMARL
jgi:HPt (histidine-containing phosphotransfer) domain-containing protein